MDRETILVLALSTYREPQNTQNIDSEPLYEFEGAHGNVSKYAGTQTNDAPVRCLMDIARQSNRPITKIMYISTYQVVNDNNGKAVNHLREVVQSECSKHNEEMPELIAIPFDYEYDQTADKFVEIERSKTGTSIYSSFEEALGNNNAIDGMRGNDGTGGKDGICGIGGIDGISRIDYGESEFYIDYTGGFRDVTFLMTSIIKYFEFKGCECRKIVYSSFGDHKIYSLDNTYRLYHLINGVQNFSATGNAKEIIAYFGECNTPGAKVARGIENFADAISICDIGGIEKAIAVLNESITDFEVAIGDDMDSKLLKTLLPYIKQKLFLNGDGRISYEKLIEWCRANHFIQQAITLYVEKIPVVLLSDNRIVQIIEHLGQESKVSLDSVMSGIGEHRYCDAFYQELYDSFSPEDIYYTGKIKKYCKQIRNEIPQKGAKPEDFREALNALEEDQSYSNDDKIIKDALGRLSTFVTNNYPDGSKIDTAALYDRPIAQRNLNGFINTLVVDNQLLHYFVFNDEKRYKEFSDMYNGKSNTAFKKSESLKKIKKNIQSLEGEKENPNRKVFEGLYDVMKYYLAVKMIRNNLNHANEDDDSDSAKEAKAFLRTEGIDIDGNDLVRAQAGNEMRFKSTDRFNRYDIIIRDGLAACGGLLRILDNPTDAKG